ncbi:MAG TPA: DUF3857 domain-containing protein [Thermoanaerobaculia bacterium]|nr:DUF3857 domain-containing protein [Thermoanaerobaculia bacterium]
MVLIGRYGTLRRRCGPVAQPGGILLTATVLLVGALAGATAGRADLPPISAADFAATAPASDPHAATLVLFKRAEFRLRDLSRQEQSSSLTEEVRLKVLDRRGLERGELEIPHSRSLRLDSLTGRTRLADGRVVPLSKAAKYERRLSANHKTWVTAVAFPAVEVGAILEYEASFFFDSFLVLEPWYLSDTAPVVYSEVEFVVPNSLKARTWGRDAFQVGVQTEQSLTPTGMRVRAWAKNLPAVPDEALSLPFEDLATQYGILTTAYQSFEQVEVLFETWQSACKLIDDWYYDHARNRDKGVKQKAREVVGALREPRQQAEALYRFVRDQIHNEDDPGVTLADDTTLEKVLAEASADSAEKALLLQDLLAAARIESRLVWANERPTGLVVPDLPNPAWFERVLVAVELGGARVYLDPSQPGLPFGWLSAEVEGETAVLFDTKKPELLTLPVRAADANRRGVSLVLTIDGEGRASGDGELVLGGQQAVAALNDPEPLDKTWQKWLADRLPGFTVSALQVTPNAELPEVKLHWSLSQRAEEVLGDEVTLTPSRPLGPLSQPLALDVRQRTTPVLLPFAGSDEVSFDVTYPAGWRVDSGPVGAMTSSDVGSLRVEVHADETARTMHYHRRLDVIKREARSADEYTHLRALYAAAEKSDAQAVALAHH